MTHTGPRCPHCFHALSLEDVDLILDDIGQTRRPGTKREKPRAYEAMPIIVAILKEEFPRSLSTHDLRDRVQEILSERGFKQKPLAISFALTYLKNDGLVDQPRYAKWRLTRRGYETPMDENVARTISTSNEQKYGGRSNSE
jgi:hypothetical protein